MNSRSTNDKPAMRPENTTLVLYNNQGRKVGSIAAAAEVARLEAQLEKLLAK